MGRIDEAFNNFDRSDFLPEEAKHCAGWDKAVAIGHGQTNSQPTTVRLMLGWLGAKEGDKVLDVGSGSGWTTALLSYLVGPKGKVYAVERIPELVRFGRDNCRRAGIRNAEFFEAGKQFGLPEYTPYDRILVSASANEVPEELKLQLKIGGKVVIPVRHDIFEIAKIAEKRYKTQIHSGFVFVPLV